MKNISHLPACVHPEVEQCAATLLEKALKAVDTGQTMEYLLSVILQTYVPVAAENLSLETQVQVLESTKADLKGLFCDSRFGKLRCQLEGLVNHALEEEAEQLAMSVLDDLKTVLAEFAIDPEEVTSVSPHSGALGGIVDTPCSKGLEVIVRQAPDPAFEGHIWEFRHDLFRVFWAVPFNIEFDEDAQPLPEESTVPAAPATSRTLLDLVLEKPREGIEDRDTQARFEALSWS